MSWRQPYWTIRNRARSIAMSVGLWKPRPSLAVLAIGQSNMEGVYGPAPAALCRPDRREQVWHLWARKFNPSRLGQRPFWMTPNGPANNLAYVFCRNLSRRRNVFSYLVTLTSVGKKLEFFLPESILEREGWSNGQTCPRHGDTLAPALFDRSGHARQALHAMNRSAYDIIIMHQGEGNFTNGAMDDEDAYFRKMVAFMAELQRAGLRDRRTLIILGKISADYIGSDAHSRALERLKSDTVAVVEWDGIQTVGGGDFHASVTGLTMLGNRYFDQYLALDTARKATKSKTSETVGASSTMTA